MAGISSREFQVRKRPRVLQECLLITGRCRVPVEGEEYHYYYHYYVINIVIIVIIDTY